MPEEQRDYQTAAKSASRKMAQRAERLGEPVELSLQNLSGRFG
jgi:hypothetical protein